MATAVFADKVTDRLPQGMGTVGQSQKCVLLIEDCEDAMLLVRYALQAHGRDAYQLEWTSCLKDGLSRVMAGGIDIILLDLGLPDSTGSMSYSLVHQAAPETPVLILTGDTREETELSVFSGGVHDYLVKEQISGTMLIQAIERALTEKAPPQHPKNMPQQYSQKFHWRPKS